MPMPMFYGKPQYYEHMSIQTWTFHMLWRNFLGADCKAVKKLKPPSPERIMLSVLFLLPNQSQTTDRTTQSPTAIDDYLIFQSTRMTSPHTYRHSMKSLENCVIKVRLSWISWNCMTSNLYVTWLMKEFTILVYYELHWSQPFSTSHILYGIRMSSKSIVWFMHTW